MLYETNPQIRPIQKVLAGLKAPGFWWLTGFEGSNIPQIGADEYEWTQHYHNWKSDLALVRQRLGIGKLRYTLPWYRLNPAPKVYNWDWSDQVIEWAAELGLELVLNPIQFGTPAWLEDSFGNPDFPNYAAEYFFQLARRYGKFIKFFTPHNEPMITALFSGDFGHWPPFWHGTRRYTRLVNNIGRQIIRSVEVLRQEIPDAVMIHVDAGEFYATTSQNKPFLLEDIALRNERRFIFYDLVSGRMGKNHLLQNWLLKNGMTEQELNWFEEHAIELDVVGVDFYPHSEIWLDIEGEEITRYCDHGYKIVRVFARTGDCSKVKDLVNLPISLSGVLKQYYERYKRPIMLTETDYCGLEKHKAIYLQYSVAEVGKARAEGIPVVGYTWWPALDHLNWDQALKQQGAIHPVGLWQLQPQPGWEDERLERIETVAVKVFYDLIHNPQGSVGDVLVLPSVEAKK